VVYTFSTAFVSGACKTASVQAALGQAGRVGDVRGHSADDGQRLWSADDGRQNVGPSSS